MVLQVLLRNIRDQAISIAGSGAGEKADILFDMRKGELFKTSEESIKAAILIVVHNPDRIDISFSSKIFRQGDHDRVIEGVKENRMARGKLGKQYRPDVDRRYPVFGMGTAPFSGEVPPR